MVLPAGTGVMSHNSLYRSQCINMPSNSVLDNAKHLHIVSIFYWQA